MINNKLQVYKNLKVVVTGSTGFKGTWLCFWLYLLNAKVTGIALKPEKNSILFNFNFNNRLYEKTHYPSDC